LLHLSKEVGLTKKSGIKVVRATIPKSSDLIGRKPAESNFRELYKATIVAYQKKGRNASIEKEFTEGDLLLLQVFEGSPLLVKPPDNFYGTKGNPVTSVDRDDVEDSLGTARAWRNIKIEFHEDDGRVGTKCDTKGEFLVALVVPPRSPHVNKSMNELGYTSLPGIFLVGLERPTEPADGVAAGTLLQSVTDDDAVAQHLSLDDKLREGDILWMSGSADAIADLQNLHGFQFFHNDEMEKATACLQDRRMVQAVVARGSPLVGKTVAETHFRSNYGGAVIAIQRGSERIHEHPGRVPLQTGDALLIQAGPDFYERQKNDYRTFALVSEVENSSPPRPRLFLLCVVMIVTSLVVASLEMRNLLITASIVGILMVSMGVVTQQEARDSVHWDLFIVIASAFGISNAMEASGFAGLVATAIVSVGDAIGIGGTFAVVDDVDDAAGGGGFGLTFMDFNLLVSSGLGGMFRPIVD
jgi:K+/H+ antiporter YhaU regulatory subunit KhtT